MADIESLKLFPCANVVLKRDIHVRGKTYEAGTTIYEGEVQFYASSIGLYLYPWNEFISSGDVRSFALCEKPDLPEE